MRTRSVCRAVSRVVSCSGLQRRACVQGELGVLTITGDVVKVAVNHALLKFYLLVTLPSVDEAVLWYPSRACRVCRVSCVVCRVCRVAWRVVALNDPALR